MVEISKSGSGEGLGGVIPRGYSKRPCRGEAVWVLSTCRTRAGSPAKIRTWAAAHEAHVTTFHSANARVRSAR